MGVISSLLVGMCTMAFSFVIKEMFHKIHEPITLYQALIISCLFLILLLVADIVARLHNQEPKKEENKETEGW